MAEVYVNDIDLAGYGFVMAGLTGHPDAPTITDARATTSGREVWAGEPAQVAARTIQLKGNVSATTNALLVAALDTLKALCEGGAVRLRFADYLTQEYRDARCRVFQTTARAALLTGVQKDVTIEWDIAEPYRYAVNPDGYALTTTKQACPVGTAVSRPVILVHGGGASLTNPTVTITNAAGDTVAAVSFTVSLGASDVLRIDAERGTVSKIASGVVSDAIAAGLWTSTTAPTDLILRPADGWFESSAWPCVAVSSTGGTAVGSISYTRRYL
jgi:hypothetical protein